MEQNITLNKKIVASCFFASCLEIYDFVIFAFFSANLQKEYFVFLEQGIMEAVTYILFAIGFVFRPVGSLIFGYIGDKWGRHKNMILSVSLMGCCSLIMFLLPPYSYIGIASCYIIVAVRIIQGISVGGEFTGALVFAIEHEDRKKAGIVGGILAAGGAGGVLLANIVSNFLKNPAFPEYSWRFAFLLGFSLSIVGYIIRSKLSETPVFRSIKRSDSVPLLEGLKNYKKECAVTVLIAAANGTGMYFSTMFLPNYLAGKANVDTKFLSMFVTFLIMLSCPLAGFVSDKFSKWRVLSGSCLLMSGYILIMLPMLTSNYGLFIILVPLYCLIFAFMAASINTFAVEVFPPEVRMSCSSISYSLGMGLIGGTVPTVSSLIVSKFGSNPMYLAMYVSLICFLASLSTFALMFKKVSNLTLKVINKT